MLVTVGAVDDKVKVNWSVEPATVVPVGVVTVMSTVAAVSAGEVAVQVVAVEQLNDAAAVEPNLTAVAPVRLVPVMVTLVPPDVGPDVGVTSVIVGEVALVNVNLSAELVALVALPATTVTSTCPAPAGDVTVICVSDVTLRLVPGADPKFTAVAPVKLLPLTVTLLPPATVPLVGLIPVTVGAAVYVNWSLVEVALLPPGPTTVTST
jgi:hypothetical protein